MKKLICIATALICLLASAIPCYASPDIIYTVTANQPKFQNITVDINVSKDSSLYTTEFYIIYSAHDVEFIEGSEKGGDIVKELDPYITATVVDYGKIKVSYTSTKPLDSAGVLCSLKFRAKTTGFVNFNIEVEHAESFNGEEIYSLTTLAESTAITAKKQASAALIITIVTGCVAIAAAVTYVALNKKTNKKKSK